MSTADAMLRGVVRRQGRLAIEGVLARDWSRRLAVGALSRGWVRRLPASLREPILLHIAEYSRHHPEFFSELEREFAAGTNDEFQSAFWGSDFGRFFLEQTEEAFWTKDAYRLCRELADECGGDTSYLDVACGYGVFARWLKKTYPRADVCGVDISERVLHEALARAAHQRVDVRFVRGSASTLAERFEPKSFDVVVCLEAFYYMADGLDVLRQLIAVARRRVFVMTTMGSLDDEEYRRLEKPIERHDYDLSWIHPLLAYTKALGMEPHRSGRTGANCFFVEIRIGDR
jgi:SAM-dependent methyltransferase